MIINELIKLFGDNKKIIVKINEDFLGYETDFGINMMAEITKIKEDSEGIELTFDATNYIEYNQENALFYNYETDKSDLNYKEYSKVCTDAGYNHDLKVIESRCYNYNEEIDFEVVEIK